MSTIIYLKVAKVGSQNADMTTLVERNTITLEAGKNFNNFVKHLHVQNYINTEPPVVVKVIEMVDGKIKSELDKSQYQKQVQEALDKMKNPTGQIDYKKESEKQSKVNADLLERLEALENKGDNDKSEDREALEAKAKELGIEFRSNIGDNKLLEKIQKIEPDYKL